MNPEIDMFLPQYSPIAFHGGFLHADLDAVVSEYCEWLRERTRRKVSTTQQGGIAAAIAGLGPLRDPWNRILFIETRNGWCGVYCNGFRAADITSTVSVLASRLKVQGVYYTSCPTLVARNDPTKLLMQGALKFAVFEESSWTSLTPTRIVQLLQEDEKWVFYQNGDPLPSENPADYRSRSIKTRLSTFQIQSYLQALGISANDEAYFGTRFAIVEDVGLPEAREVRLSEVRRLLNLDSEDGSLVG